MALSPTSSRGSSGGGGNVLVASSTLGAPGTIDLTGLAQTYNDLLIIALVRGSASSTSDSLLMRFNNDTAANYQCATVTTSAATLVAASTTSLTFAIPGNNMVGNTATANYFSQYVIYVAGYASTTWVKSYWSQAQDTHGPLSTDIRTGYNAGQWQSTAAINRLTFMGSGSANLVTGSQIRVYGVT